MAEQTEEATIREINDLIKRISTEIDEDVLRRCLNETWFSDTLAWLLDPKGNHGFGVEFAKAFVRTVAKKRSDGESIYSHKKSHLRWGKGGKGQSATQFKFENSASLREFFLSQEVKKNNKEEEKSQLYCDVAFMDLDSEDGIILVIENKLFSINTKDQLLHYHEAIEKKFKKVDIREYVYLTLHGDAPKQYEKEKKLHGDARQQDEKEKESIKKKKRKIKKEKRLIKEWVRLSWISDIRQILEDLNPEKDRCPEKVTEFFKLLQYLHYLTKGKENLSSEPLRLLLKKVASDCLFEELQRLATKKGKWKRHKDNKISHSSLSAKHLKIGLLPNQCVTVQGMHGKKAMFDKILIPFGAHPEQIYSLFDIAARDIYHVYFGEEYKKYLNDRRKLTTTVTPEREKHHGMLKFIHKNRHHLQVMLQKNLEVQKEAQSQEYENAAAADA